MSRTAGSLNRKTQDLLNLCKKKKLNVFESMIELATTTQNEQLRFAMLKELASYLYPKRKAVEISNADENGFKVVIKDYSEK